MQILRISFFTLQLGNPEKDWKTVLVNISLVDITYTWVCETAVLKKSFVRISQRNERKENPWAVFSVLKFSFGFHIWLQIQIQIFQFNAPVTRIFKSCFYSTAVVKIYITNAKIEINCTLSIIICSLQGKPVKCS